MKDYICRSQFEMFPQKGHFSKLGAHQTMIADRVRMSAFKDAIFKVVKEGDIVLDIGCGTGILSFFAVQAGAKMVYALDRGPIIKLAKQVASDNGFSDKITFIQKDSFDVGQDEIKEKVDVIISETVGFWGIDERIVEIMVDAKKRFGTDNTALLPNRLELYLAPVSAKKESENISFWHRELFGINFSKLGELARNNIYVRNVFVPKDILSGGKRIAEFNLGVDQKTSFNKELEFLIENKCSVDGFAGWFSVQLTEDISLSTSPQKPISHWKHCFFPINPVLVDKSDYIKIEMGVDNNMVFDWAVSPDNKHTTKRFVDYVR